MDKAVPGISVGPSVSAALRLGDLKGAVDGVKLAKEFFNIIYDIVKLKLPIHIYLDSRVVDVITKIFDEMGAKYILRPVEELEPPYILIRQENNILDILTVEEDDKPVTIVATKLDSFLKTFVKLFRKKYPEKSKKVLELLEEGVGEEKEEVTEVEGRETSVTEGTGEEHSIEETLKGFESE